MTHRLIHFPSKNFLIQTRGPAFFSLISILGPLVGLVTGTLTARWLTPNEFGVVQTALLLAPYLTFLTFGIYHGLNRNYPYMIGLGEPGRALDLAGASKLATKYITLLTLVLAVIYAARLSLRSPEVLLIVAVWAAIPTFLVYPISTHYEVLYRTNHDFLRFGWIQLIGYVLSLVTIVLVFGFGFIGQWIRLIVIALSNCFLRWVWRPLRFTPDGNWKDVKLLATVGVPLLVVGYLTVLFSVADRTVVALKMGTEAVGYYALTGIVIASMSAFPMAISQVVLPKASTVFGATHHAQALRKYVWMSVLLSSAVLLPIALVGWFVLPVLVAWLLPQYVPGIAAAQVGLIAGAIGMPQLSVFFLVLQKNRAFIAVLAVNLLFVWAASLIAVANGGTLVTISWIRVIATAFLTATSMAYALVLTR